MDALQAATLAWLCTASSNIKGNSQYANKNKFCCYPCNEVESVSWLFFSVHRKNYLKETKKFFGWMQTVCSLFTARATYMCLCIIINITIIVTISTSSGAVSKPMRHFFRYYDVMFHGITVPLSTHLLPHYGQRWLNLWEVLKESHCCFVTNWC